MHVLHDGPAYGLFVLPVDARGFDEFALDLGDAGGVGEGVEVADECVDHDDV